jgi:hypothetical protein
MRQEAVSKENGLLLRSTIQANESAMTVRSVRLSELRYLSLQIPVREVCQFLPLDSKEHAESLIGGLGFQDSLEPLELVESLPFSAYCCERSVPRNIGVR